ncbi:MAG: alanine racemase [Rhodobacterales bacterium]|nr:alanine racemase [Rhodobacterales bacterium]
MASATLSIDLNALISNWRALDAASSATVETGAVVKADGYGLGAAKVARALANIGVRRFFVALTEEGAALRSALGPGPEINVLSGHMSGDTDMIGDLDLTPILNSVEQMLRHFESLPGHQFGLQLDTGMGRLGMSEAEWTGVRDIAMGQNPRLIISHLACADDPDHPMNTHQLHNFHQMTADIEAPRSLAATGGILLGPDYHFDLTRPGIGLYGGAPFGDALPVATLDIPVIQSRELPLGATVGYGNTWVAPQPSIIATLAAGYADGLIRAMGATAQVYADGIPCPIVGRISMDMIGVDITHLDHTPTHLQIIGPAQSVDTLATHAGTIGYEILTSLGARYTRRYSSS